MNAGCAASLSSLEQVSGDAPLTTSGPDQAREDLPDFQPRWRGASTAAVVREALGELDPPPAPLGPLYVRSCYRNPDRDPSLPPWLSWVVNREALIAGGPELVLCRSPRACGSWRCLGCRDYVRKQQFARIVETLDAEVPDRIAEDEKEAWLSKRCLMLTLTYDGDFHDLSKHSLDTLYKEIGERMTGFRGAFARVLASTCQCCKGHRLRNRYWASCDCGKARRVDEFRKLGPTYEDTGRKWLANLEQHANGVPHVNVVFYDPLMAQLFRELIKARQKLGLRGYRARCIAGVDGHRTGLENRIHAVLTRYGFGFRSFCEPPQNLQAVINYANGGAANADETATSMHRWLLDAKKAELKSKPLTEDVARMLREVSKSRQIPVMAPAGTRRLRSAKRWIKPKKASDFTGIVLKTYYSPEGDVDVRALVPSQKPHLQALEVIAIAREQQLIERAENEYSKELERERQALARLSPEAPPEAAPAFEWGESDVIEPDRGAWSKPLPERRARGSDVGRRRAVVRRRMLRGMKATTHVYNTTLGTWHDAPLKFYGPEPPAPVVHIVDSVPPEQRAQQFRAVLDRERDPFVESDGFVSVVDAIVSALEGCRE